MPKKRTILIGAITLLLIGFSLYLSCKFDSVRVIPHQETIHDLDGHTKTYDFAEYEPNNRIARVASELLCTIAIALFIYFVIERTLISNQEKQQKKEQEEFRDKIIKDVLQEVLKRFVPGVLFDAIINDVLNQHFIAEDVTWEYTIEDHTTHYRVIQRSTSDFRNVSSTTQQLPFRMAVYQNSNNKSWFELFRVSTKHGESETVLFSETKEEIERNARLMGNSKARLYIQEVKSNETVTVTYKVVNDYSSKYIQDIHFSNYSITDLNIRINTLPGCQFSAIATFSKPLEDDEKKSDDKALIYKEIKGILKGQSFIFFIEPKAKSADPTPIQEPVASITNISNEKTEDK